MPDKLTQLDQFKESVGQLETDDDPERFRERLARLVKHKPADDGEKAE